MAMKDVSVVLAHGAWADGSSWARVITAVQRPISLSCITIPDGRPHWKGIPRWFLLAEDERMIVPETQRYMAGRMKAKIRAYAVDHAPSVTAPTAVVDVIRDAIRSV